MFCTQRHQSLHPSSCSYDVKPIVRSFEHQRQLISIVHEIDFLENNTLHLPKGQLAPKKMKKLLPYEIVQSEHRVISIRGDLSVCYSSNFSGDTVHWNAIRHKEDRSVSTFVMCKIFPYAISSTALWETVLFYSNKATKFDGIYSLYPLALSVYIVFCHTLQVTHNCQVQILSRER